MTSNARPRVRALTAAGTVAAALTATLVAASAAAADPGDLDKRFGVKGKVETSFGGSSDSAGNAIDRDGNRLVVAGTVMRGGEERFAIARYRGNGRLDDSFAGDGRRVTGFRGGDAVANGVTVEGDGAVVVAGEAGSKIAMVRYRADGRLDRSFSRDGKDTTAFPDGSVRAADVALQDDGRIVVVGTFTGEGSAPPSDFAVARYLRSGRLDRTFGDRGRVTTGFGVPGSDLAVGNAVVVQPEGAIVAAGALNNPFQGGGAFALARYDQSGELDPSFGGGTGTVTTEVGNEGGAIDLVRRDNGSLVAAGESAQPDPPGLQSFFTLIRYGEDGEQDTNFGRNGIVRTSFPRSDDPFATGVGIQPDNRIVAVGQVGLGGDRSVFGVARYRRGGKLDRGFGDRGRVTTRFARQSEDEANGVTIVPRGGIVAAGSTDAGFALARYRMGGR